MHYKFTIFYIIIIALIGQHSAVSTGFDRVVMGRLYRSCGKLQEIRILHRKQIQDCIVGHCELIGIVYEKFTVII